MIHSGTFYYYKNRTERLPALITPLALDLFETLTLKAGGEYKHRVEVRYPTILRTGMKPRYSTALT